jgi:hypothetical protein
MRAVRIVIIIIIIIIVIANPKKSNFVEIFLLFLFLGPALFLSYCGMDLKVEKVKNFQRNYLESEKFFSKFSYFLEREN